VEYEVSSGHFLTLLSLSSETGTNSRFGVRYVLELRTTTGAWSPGLVAFDATDESAGVVTWPCVVLTAVAPGSASVHAQTVLDVGTQAPAAFVYLAWSRTATRAHVDNCRTTAVPAGSHTFANVDSSFATLAWAVP